MKNTHNLARYTSAVMLFFLLFSAPVWGAGEGAGGWTFHISPYLWFPAVDGSANLRGRQVSVHQGISSVLKEINYAAMVRMEAGKGRWGFFLDPLYANMRSDSNVGFIDVKVKSDFWLLGFGGYYRVAQWKSVEDSNRHSSLDLLFGGRYFDIDSGIDVGIPMMGVVDVAERTQWVDPFAGLRLRAHLSEKIFFEASGDVGGADAFSGSSHFSYNLEAGFGYYLLKNMSIFAGYRALYANRVDGSGYNRFAWDATMHGPAIGVGVRF